MINKYLMFLLVIVLGIKCRTEQPIRSVEQTQILMDTFIQIVVYDQHKPEQEIHQIIDAAFEKIEKIDQITNIYNDSSKISLVNQRAGSDFVRINPTLKHLLEKSIDISQKTNGAFDNTVGLLKNLWGFHSDTNFIPHPDSIKKYLEFVDYRLIELNENTLRFRKAGLKVDLGGIAKGYAIDEAVEVLKLYNVKDAMINAGGDLRAFCSALTKGKRKIWIKHPRKIDQAKLFGYFKMDEGSVATSGDYERFFIEDGVRYHHILHPKTGYPARECVSVTVQAENAELADALATALFVMGPEDGMNFVESQKNVEAIILFEENNQLNWIASKKLENKFVKN